MSKVTKEKVPKETITLTLEAYEKRIMQLALAQTNLQKAYRYIAKKAMPEYQINSKYNSGISLKTVQDTLEGMFYDYDELISTGIPREYLEEVTEKQYAKLDAAKRLQEEKDAAEEEGKTDEF